MTIEVVQKARDALRAHLTDINGAKCAAKTAELIEQLIVAHLVNAGSAVQQAAGGDHGI